MELLKIILINIVLLLIIAIVVLLTGQYMDNKNTEHQHSVPKIETSPIVISKELNQPTEVQVLPQKTEEEPILEPPKEESPSINELPENENVEKEPFRIPDVDDEKTVKNKLLAQNLLTDLLKVKNKRDFQSFCRWYNKASKLIRKTDDPQWQNVISKIQQLGLDYLLIEWAESPSTLATLESLKDTTTIHKEDQTIALDIDITLLKETVRTIPLMQVYYDEAYNLVQSNIKSKLLFPGSAMFPPFAVYDHVTHSGDDYFINSFFITKGQNGLEEVKYEAVVHKYYHGYSIQSCKFSNYSVFANEEGIGVQ